MRIRADRGHQACARNRRRRLEYPSLMNSPIREFAGRRASHGAIRVGAAIAFAIGGPLQAGSPAPRIFQSGFETLPCVGLECFQVGCPAAGSTTVSGKVFAPNGTLPLPNVVVYVRNAPLQAFAAGAQCARCDIPPSGAPLVLTRSGGDGSFVLQNVPATTQVPLVVQSGKWRREILIPSVSACANTALADGSVRLPRDASEGDLPLIAVSTGAADAQECLLRKAGIADSEFTPAGGNGRVHLFAGGGGTDAIDVANGGEALTASATTLWDALPHLAPYDLVVLSCEGAQALGSKPLTARQAMKDYVDSGGRVLFGHWHNDWLQAGPAPWPALATWNFLSTLPATTFDVATGFARGDELAQWVVASQASAVSGKVSLPAAKHTVTAVDAARVRKRLFKDVTANGMPSVQYFSFTTPAEDPIDAHCGRVAFTDLHASGGDSSNVNLAFPSGGCQTPVGTLSAEEKLELYALFDLGSCVGNATE
jgi:hypothetical protein